MNDQWTPSDSDYEMSIIQEALYQRPTNMCKKDDRTHKQQDIRLNFRTPGISPAPALGPLKIYRHIPIGELPSPSKFRERQKEQSTEKSITDMLAQAGINYYNDCYKVSDKLKSIDTDPDRVIYDKNMPILMGETFFKVSGRQKCNDNRDGSISSSATSSSSVCSFDNSSGIFGSSCYTYPKSGTSGYQSSVTTANLNNHMEFPSLARDPNLRGISIGLGSTLLGYEHLNTTDSSDSKKVNSQNRVRKCKKHVKRRMTKPLSFESMHYGSTSSS